MKDRTQGRAISYAQEVTGIKATVRLRGETARETVKEPPCLYRRSSQLSKSPRVYGGTSVYLFPFLTEELASF